MKLSDEFSVSHRELLEGGYDCVDRIVLNGYLPLGHTGGGFRTWWRRLTGSDESLDQMHLLRMARDFSRRVHAYARSNTAATCFSTKAPSWTRSEERRLSRIRRE